MGVLTRNARRKTYVADHDVELVEVAVDQSVGREPDNILHQVVVELCGARHQTRAND